MEFSYQQIFLETVFWANCSFNQMWGWVKRDLRLHFHFSHSWFFQGLKCCTCNTQLKFVFFLEGLLLSGKVDFPRGRYFSQIWKPFNEPSNLQGLSDLTAPSHFPACLLLRTTPTKEPFSFPHPANCSNLTCCHVLSLFSLTTSFPRAFTATDDLTGAGAVSRSRSLTFDMTPAPQ